MVELKDVDLRKVAGGAVTVKDVVDVNNNNIGVNAATAAAVLGVAARAPSRRRNSNLRNSRAHKKMLRFKEKSLCELPTDLKPEDRCGNSLKLRSIKWPAGRSS
jgi:hypothetical protein